MIDELGWPDDGNHRDIDTGQTTLQATGALADFKALSHLQTVQKSELGYIFIGGDGKVVFHDRHARLKSPFTTSQATFGDDAAENRYKIIDPSFDDEYIYNDIRITRSGGTQQNAVDATSQDDYGKRSFTRTGLLMTLDLEAQSMANYLRSQYKAPVLRASRLILSPENDPANLWPKALNYDIGTRITVRLNQASIDEDYHIEQVQHDYMARTGVFRTSWQLSNANNQKYWAINIVGFSEINETTRVSY